MIAFTRRDGFDIDNFQKVGCNSIESHYWVLKTHLKCIK